MSFSSCAAKTLSKSSLSKSLVRAISQLGLVRYLLRLFHLANPAHAGARATFEPADRRHHSAAGLAITDAPVLVLVAGETGGTALLDRILHRTAVLALALAPALVFLASQYALVPLRH